MSLEDYLSTIYKGTNPGRTVRMDMTPARREQHLKLLTTVCDAIDASLLPPEEKLTVVFTILKKMEDAYGVRIERTTMMGDEDSVITDYRR